MSARYAKDQPAGFSNRIEKVAVVGVSQAQAAIFALEAKNTHADGQW